MKAVSVLRRIGIAGVTIAIASLAVGVGTAWAAGTKVCVPTAAETAITTASASGTCKAGYTKTTMLPEAEQEKLEQILPYVKFVAKGIDEKPTIQFSGANVQVINGEGKTGTTNGEGNLVIGYDEHKTLEGERIQTGSHDLILGTGQEYTSYGSILAGYDNKALASDASVTGGYDNTASNTAASVSGGEGNTASACDASVSGGADNTANHCAASVSGGYSNTAGRDYASVGGGRSNTASGEWAAISGGNENTATGVYGSILGGRKNLAEGEWSAIYGGKEVTASKEYEAIG
jgi:hypothetical protein